MYTFLQKQAPNFVAMRALQQHILTIIANYDGKVPLTHFLKSYYKQHPILGSRDRKIIADAVYSYYRCAKALPDSLSASEKTGLSLLLAEHEHIQSDKLIPEDWRNSVSMGIEEKIPMLANNGISVAIDRLLPDSLVFSEGIERNDWLRAMWKKPRVFFRIIAKNRLSILEKLQTQGIAVTVEGENAYSCAAGVSLDKCLQPHEYRIQDLSSQQTANYFSLKKGESVWDCCSGAGGKSLLACETEPGIRLTVSDVRASILHNLSDRFRLYGRAVPEQILVSAADSEALAGALNQRSFDHIIADVPCTGSGTWSRTPEQLYFFDPACLATFTERQKSIIKNVSAYVQAGGLLTYITCSVFRAENEEVIHSLLQDSEFEQVASGSINGISRGADCMYAALLRKR